MEKNKKIKGQFIGDISHLSLSGTSLKGFDVSQVSKWPRYIGNIEWEGVVNNLTSKPSTWSKEIWMLSKNKLEGDISSLELIFSCLRGIDVSKVTKWPTSLCNVNWYKIIGLNSENTPFKGDISRYVIWCSRLGGVDVSQVTKWPPHLFGIDWESVKCNLNTKPKNWTQEVWNLIQEHKQ